MLNSEGSDSRYSFLTRDEERVMGLYLPKANRPGEIAYAMVFWPGASSLKSLSNFGRTMRDQHQKVSETFSARVNAKEILNLNSSADFNRLHEVLYRIRRKRIKNVNQELNTFVLMPWDPLMTSAVAYSERDDQEGIAPEVAVLLYARALHRPVIVNALRRLIHESSTYPIPDTVIDEAFARVEAHEKSAALDI